LTKAMDKKWVAIINAFMENRIDELMSIQRTGSRGRILAYLVGNMFDCIDLHYQSEPFFDHKAPNEWYINFSNKIDDIKLRVHDFYNPDFLLDDGSWIEVTLSENTAYKKLFRHGHQADFLRVIWLDPDNGLHKKVCQSIQFPNAEVVNIERYYDQLKQSQKGIEIINKVVQLKQLKGVVM
jgi:hypothetical protein